MDAMTVVVLILYFWPSIVALNKKRANTGAIVLVNMFLGWTLIGWLVALVWAMTEKKTKAQEIEMLAEALKRAQGGEK